MIKYEIKDTDELVRPAREVIRLLEKHPVACFYGEMGAGKTTFIKQICKEMGVEDDTSSPTFAIVNEYLDGEGRSVYHFDFYRIKNLGEALDVGAEEYFYSGGPCLIEWPEMINQIIPEEHLEINIKLVEDNKRELTITTRG